MKQNVCRQGKTVKKSCAVLDDIEASLDDDEDVGYGKTGRNNEQCLLKASVYRRCQEKEGCLFTT